MAIAGSDTPSTDGAIFGTDPGAFYSSGAQGTRARMRRRRTTPKRSALGTVRVT